MMLAQCAVKAFCGAILFQMIVFITVVYKIVVRRTFDITVGYTCSIKKGNQQ
jgi:hypothetical protein